MILQALYRYYQILQDDPESHISEPGFSSIRAHFALVLSEQGKLVGLIPLVVEERRGNKTVERPRRLSVPEQALRAGKKIVPNFLWDNVTYVLGISDRDEDDPAYARERHAAFKEFNTALLQQADCGPAQAVIRFLENHTPANFKASGLYQQNAEQLATANLVFKILGAEGFVHDEPEIRKIWKVHRMINPDAVIGQCLITGELTEIELTHNKIKGVPGGQASGTAIVSFNERAYESFNRRNQQGLNAPVGKEAMFGYTTALNYLLRSQRQKIVIDDTTVVFWAESHNPLYTDLYSKLLNPDGADKEKIDHKRASKSEQLLQVILSSIKQGKPLDAHSLFEGLDENVRFYVLGLSPNAGRLAVRFFYVDPYKKAIDHLIAHHQDMLIADEYRQTDERFFPLWQIIRETVPKKAKKAAPPPLLTGAVFRSVLMDLPYPAALYYAYLNRIRSDQDDRDNRISKINQLRAAVIKAHLIRKYHHKNKYQEELQMALNTESTHQAYLLGRLFAVLEKAQIDALGKDINATIKDRYFTSACATPATTFPILLRLAQHHIAKAEYGYVSDRRIGEIMEKLEIENNPFPKHLNLDEQGIFVLGYYHQRTDFYTKKLDLNVNENQEVENV